jgi:hypothetical protein
MRNLLNNNSIVVIESQTACVERVTVDAQPIEQQ